MGEGERLVYMPMRNNIRRDAHLSPSLAVIRYGAYGSKQWPSFNPADLSLLDRGWVLAVAHVRGGGEMGAVWHIHGATPWQTVFISRWEQPAFCCTALHFGGDLG